MGFWGFRLVVLLNFLRNSFAGHRRDSRPKTSSGRLPLPRLPADISRPFGVGSNMIPQGRLNRLVPP
jgi:hypothetical protein